MLGTRDLDWLLVICRIKVGHPQQKPQVTLHWASRLSIVNQNKKKQQINMHQISANIHNNKNLLASNIVKYNILQK